MHRRQFLSRVAGTAALTVASTSLGQSKTPSSSRSRVLRAVHLTDTHVFAERGAEAGLAEALRHAQSQKPDLVLFGGDLIMDALGKEKDAALAQWDLWDRVTAAHLRTPHRACLGNHDVWGWKLPNRPELTADRHYGKAMAIERLALPGRYYSFDQAGWHFVVLDSTHPRSVGRHGYTAMLDEEQFTWLARDLTATPPTVPVCVLSHIPILTLCAMLDGENEKTGDWVVPGAWMHIDARRIKSLFHRHPNVKVCLSGHIHLADDVTYLGVRYLCNGAVCGGWWKGPYQEFSAAYATVDFFDDGTVDNHLIFYGPQAAPPAAVAPVV